MLMNGAFQPQKMDKSDKVIVVSKVLGINRGDAEAVVAISESIDNYPDQIREPVRKLAGNAAELQYHEDSPVEGWDRMRANQLGISRCNDPDCAVDYDHTHIKQLDKWQGEYHDGAAVLKGAI